VCDLLWVAPARSADGVALFAKNSDRPPAEVQVWESFTGEIPFVGSRPSWMEGVEHGVNVHGVAAGNATIYTTLDPRGGPPGLTGMHIVRLVLERCATAAQAVELVGRLVEEVGQGGSGHEGVDRPYWSSFLLADPTEAFVVETSGRVWMAEPAGEVRAVSNRTTIPAFDAEHRHPRQPVETLVDPRLRASEACLSAPVLDAAALRAHLSSHAGGAGGWTICMHVDGVEATTASLVAELRPGGASTVWHAQGSPCVTPYIRATATP
jgi:hypothetical protein